MPPRDDTHFEPLPPKKEGAGPIAGIVIIVIVVLFGALYFWGSILNKQQEVEQLPLITGSTSIQL